MSIGQTIVDKLKAAFPDARLTLEDATGNDDHWELHIASADFAGLSKVKQHQAIYKPLRALLDSNQVHALRIHTYSHEQWQKRQGQ